jgi:hypothetical protein
VALSVAAVVAAVAMAEVVKAVRTAQRQSAKSLQDWASTRRKRNIRCGNRGRGGRTEHMCDPTNSPDSDRPKTKGQQFTIRPEGHHFAG